MSTTLLCASVIGPTINDAEKQIKELNHHADIVELRLDLLDLDYTRSKSSELVYTLIRSVRKPVIATFRSPLEGGKKEVSDKVRNQLLKGCIFAGAKYVDLELGSERKEIDSLIREAHTHNAKVILSTHNFEKTPSLAESIRFVNAASRMGADIVKSASMVSEKKDNATVEALMDFCAEKKIPFIAIGMGDEKTRFSAIEKGAFLTFGRMGVGSAPGQPTLARLRQFKRKQILLGWVQKIKVPFQKKPRVSQKVHGTIRKK